jgi:alginate O-acetyltransferase complex protein AlgI
MAERWAGRRPAYQHFPRALRVALTFILVLGSWVWFRAESLQSALVYFQSMLGGSVRSETTALLAAQLYAPDKLLLMAIGVLLLCVRTQAHEWSETLTWPKVLILPPAFATALMVMFSQAANPFLYFQF